MALTNTYKNNGVLVVNIQDAKILDESQVKALGEELTGAMNRCEDGRLLVNFSGVRFMSSAVLGQLIRLKKRCDESKVDLRLSNISEQIMEVFRMTKLHKVFTIYDDEAKALKAFERKGWFLSS